MDRRTYLLGQLLPQTIQQRIGESTPETIRRTVDLVDAAIRELDRTAPPTEIPEPKSNMIPFPGLRKFVAENQID